MFPRNCIQSCLTHHKQYCVKKSIDLKYLPHFLCCALYEASMPSMSNLHFFSSCITKVVQLTGTLQGPSSRMAFFINEVHPQPHPALMALFRRQKSSIAYRIAGLDICHYNAELVLDVTFSQSQVVPYLSRNFSNVANALSLVLLFWHEELNSNIHVESDQ